MKAGVLGTRVQCTLVQCTLVQCTLYPVTRTDVKCTLYSSQFRVVQYSVYSVQLTLLEGLLDHQSQNKLIVCNEQTVCLRNREETLTVSERKVTTLIVTPARCYGVMLACRFITLQF